MTDSNKSRNLASELHKKRRNSNITTCRARKRSVVTPLRLTSLALEGTLG
jgi:hypothetical protein